MSTQLTGGERRLTMADLTIKFKGNPIVELSESGTKTLKTSGKYCEGDISVEYAKPAGGGGSGGTGTEILTYGKSYAASEFTIDTSLFTTSVVANIVEQTE